MTYCWATDFSRSYSFALRMLALRIGSVRPADCFELYMVERDGGIP